LSLGFGREPVRLSTNVLAYELLFGPEGKYGTKFLFVTVLKSIAFWTETAKSLEIVMTF